VDARATVDLGRVLPAQDVDSHVMNASARDGLAARPSRQ
jgi:hypothetical protein